MHVVGHDLLYLASCGTQRLFAPIVRPPSTSASADSSLLLSLMASSHWTSPQNGTRTSLPLLSSGLKLFQSSTDASLSSLTLRALSYISFCTASSVSMTVGTSLSCL